MRILVEYLLVGDDFPIDVMATEIGINDCEISYIGDSVYGGPHKNLFIRNEECSSILYSTGYIETMETEIPLRMLYDILYEKKDIILKYIEKYSLESKFCITLCLSDNPEIMIPKEVLELAAYLKAFIEFDTYLDYDENEKIILSGKTS